MVTPRWLRQHRLPVSSNMRTNMQAVGRNPPSRWRCGRATAALNGWQCRFELRWTAHLARRSAATLREATEMPGAIVVALPRLRPAQAGAARTPDVSTTTSSGQRVAQPLARTSVFQPASPSAPLNTQTASTMAGQGQRNRGGGAMSLSKAQR